MIKKLSQESNLLTFILLFLLTLLAFKVSLFFLILIPVAMILIFWTYQPQIRQWMIFIILGGIFALIPILINYSLPTIFQIDKLIDLISYPRQAMINHINIYGEEVSWLALLFVFNFNNQAYPSIYQLLVNMNILHLIVVSGFHISLLVIILSFILKFLPNKCRSAIILIILIFYVYLLNFSIPSLRAFFAYGLTLIFKKSNSRYNHLIFITFMFVMFDPQIINSISFQLSFIGTACAIAINQRLQTYQPVLKPLLVTTNITYALLPITNQLNRNLNLTAPILVMIFSSIIPFYLIYCLAFIWITPLIAVHQFIAFIIIDGFMHPLSNLVVSINLARLGIYDSLIIGSFTLATFICKTHNKPYWFLLFSSIVPLIYRIIVVN